MGMSSAVCSVAYIPPNHEADYSGLIGTPIAGALLNADHGSFAGVVGYSAGGILIGTTLALVARMYISKGKVWARA